MFSALSWNDLSAHLLENLWYFRHTDLWLPSFKSFWFTVSVDIQCHKYANALWNWRFAPGELWLCWTSRKKKHLNFSKVRDLISISGLIVCSGGGLRWKKKNSNNNQEPEIYNQINKITFCCSSTKHLYSAYQPVKLFSFHNSSLFPEQP